MEKLRKVLGNLWFGLLTLVLVISLIPVPMLVLLEFGWLPAKKFWKAFFSMAELHPIIFLIGVGMMGCVYLAAFIETAVISGREERKKRYDRENHII